MTWKLIEVLDIIISKNNGLNCKNRESDLKNQNDVLDLV